MVLLGSTGASRIGAATTIRNAWIAATSASLAAARMAKPDGGGQIPAAGPSDVKDSSWERPPSLALPHKGGGNVPSSLRVLNLAASLGDEGTHDAATGDTSPLVGEAQAASGRRSWQ